MNHAMESPIKGVTNKRVPTLLTFPRPFVRHNLKIQSGVISERGCGAEPWPGLVKGQSLQNDNTTHHSSAGTNIWAQRCDGRRATVWLHCGVAPWDPRGETRVVTGRHHLRKPVTGTKCL